MMSRTHPWADPFYPGRTPPDDVRACYECGLRRLHPVHDVPDAAQSSIDQPPPITNTSTPVWDLVIKDMQERDQVGRARYGTPLQVGNGRDALVDAYAEALDLVVYLKQAIVERDLVREADMVAGMQADADRDRRLIEDWEHASPDIGGEA